MSASLRSFLFSLQTKLILSMVSAMLIAIFLVGAVFVFRTRAERREQALDRVAAASPAIYQQAFFALTPSEEDQPFAETLDSLASEQDVRILLTAPSGEVLHDTGGGLDGYKIDAPPSKIGDIQRGYIAWEPQDDFPERNITLVAASSRFVTSGGRALPFSIVLAVKSDTIAEAWRGVLPGIAIAALVAIPISVLAAILLARQVAQPVKRLTLASEAIARGDFEQRVDLARDDEIGRLARSFTSMAQRVGQRDAQMRALLANVSHDLKSPMTSITGYAQSLSDGVAAADEAPRIGGIIREEAEHVNRLLADLLYLGEIDAGQVITAREDVDLEALAARCARRIEPLIEPRGVRFDLDVSPDLVLHGVDPEKVERALTNVLDNAAKFTPPGGAITLRGSRVNGAIPALRCDVTNSGSAIAGGDLPRLFDRFFRGDRARRSSGGSGLGLAIARELVELNGGTIAAANEPPGHVTFTLVFPA